MEQWRKNLYALWLMRFLALMGTSLVFPFLPLYLRDLGVEGEKELARWSGAVFSVTSLAAALVSPFWGTLGDRYGRKLMILRATFGMTIVIALMGLVSGVYQLLTLRLLQGIMGGFFVPSLALITTTAPKDRVGYALGMLETSSFGGAIFGPLVGGVLADLLGFRHVFFVTACLMFLGGLVVAVLVKDEPVRFVRSRRPMLYLNTRLVLTRKPLLYTALSMMLINFAMMILQPVFPLFVESLGAPSVGVATTVGALFAVTGLTAMLAAPFWGRRSDSRGPRRTLMNSLAGSALLFAGQALAQTAYQLAPLRLLLGLFSGGVSPATQSLIVRNSPASRRAGVFGITTSISLMGGFFGPLTGGFLAAAIGMRPLFVLTGVMLVGICAVIGAAIRDDEPVAGLPRG